MDGGKFDSFWQAAGNGVDIVGEGYHPCYHINIIPFSLVLILVCFPLSKKHYS